MRYRLRSLLLFVLMVAVLLQCYLVFVYFPYRREVRNMDELKSLEVRYDSVPHGPRLLRKVFGDRWFHRVVRVQRGSLDDRRMLAVLERSRHLEYLDLTNSRGLSSTDFARLRKLDRLKGPDLFRTSANDEVLGYVGELHNMENLTLDLTSVTDAGLKHITGLTNLKNLSLNGTSITDKGLESVIALKELETLKLRGTEVTDDGIRLLTSVPTLRLLCLRRRFDFARGVSSFLPPPFPNDTRVTEECVTEMRKKVPQLHIRW